MDTTTYASRAGRPALEKSIRLRTWGSQVRDLPGAPTRVDRPSTQRHRAPQIGTTRSVLRPARRGVDRITRPRTVRALVLDYERKHANEYNLKPSTLAEYKRQNDALVDQLGDLHLCQLDEGHIAAFLGTCAPGSLPSRYSVIAALLRWAD